MKASRSSRMLGKLIQIRIKYLCIINIKLSYFIIGSPKSMIKLKITGNKYLTRVTTTIAIRARWSMSEWIL